MANSLGDLVISIGTDLGPLKSGLKMVPDVLGTMLKGGLLETGRNLADAILGTPKDLISDSVQLQASWERSTTEFEVFLGSAAKAQGLMNNLRKFAAESPLKLSESVTEARRLLSSGIDGSQIIPTMEMLSDLSVGNKGLLERLTKAYTDVIAAGRLYGTELRQFTETGIPLIDALADTLKKPKEEIRGLMEAGRIGSGDLQKALKSLTSEGGRFYQMTARGALTLEGTFDKLQDSVEQLKREFGQAIVEEAGLKNAVNDSTQFTDEMRRFVNDLRPGIHFVADTIKGVANVIGEVVRNGPLIGRTLMESIRGTNPEMAGLIDKVDAFVKSLKDFKLDPHALVDAAVEFGLTFGEVVHKVITSLGDGLTDIYEKNIKPIVDALKDAAKVWKDVREAVQSPVDMIDQLKRNKDLQNLKDAGQLPEREAFQKERFGADGFNDVIGRLEKAATRSLTLKEISDPDLKGQTLDRQHFLQGYVDDAKKLRQMQAEQEYLYHYSPNLKQAYDAREGMAKYEGSVIDLLKKDAIPLADKLGRGGKFELKGVDIGSAEASKPPVSAWKKMAEDIRAMGHKAADEAVRDRGKSPEQIAADKGIVDTKNAMAMLAGATFDAAKTIKDANAKEALMALTGAAIGTVESFKKAGIVIDTLGKYKAKLVELKPVLDAPSKLFSEQWDDLVKMQEEGRKGNPDFKFSERDFALAGADLMKKFAPAGLEVKLPNAAEFGSQAAAEVYARSNSVGGATATNLLQMMLEVERQQLDQSRRMVEEFRNNQPGVINMGPT